MAKYTLRSKCIAVLALVPLLTGCFGPSGGAPQTSTISEQKFSDIAPLTPEVFQAYLQESSFDDVVAGGIYAFGTFAGRDEKTKAYVKARKEKVEEIEGIMLSAVEKISTLETSMQDFRAIVVQTVAVLSSQDETLMKAFLTLPYEIPLQMGIVAKKRAFIDTIVKNIKTAKSEEKKAALYNLLSLSLLDLGNAYNAEMQRLYATLLILNVYQKEGTKPLFAKFENSIQKVSENVGTELAKLHQQVGIMTYGEQILYTADRLFAEETLARMKAELPALEAQMTSPGFASLSKEGQELLTAMMAELKERMELMTYQLAQPLPFTPLEKPLHFTAQADIHLIPTAHAGLKDSMYWFGGKIADVAIGAKDVAVAGAGIAWNGVKTTAVIAKDVAVGAAKITGKVVGAGIEATDATVKTVVDTGLSIYYKEPPSKILSQAKNNYAQAYNKIKDGQGGAEVFSTAKKYMEGAENSAAALAQKVVDKTWGPGIVSTTTGFVAKTTVGFFTGLAKDSYDTLNPASSEQDRLLGMLGLVMTASGGTGTFAKPADVLKSGLQTTANYLQKSKAFLSSLTPSSVASTFKNLFSGGMKAPFVDALKDLSVRGIVSNIDDMGRAALSSGKQYLDDSLKYLSQKLRKDIPDAWKGLWEKKSFGAILDDVFGTTGDTPKEWFTGYLKNLTGSIADDQFKNAVKYVTTEDEQGEPVVVPSPKLVFPISKADLLQLSDMIQKMIQTGSIPNDVGLSDEEKKEIQQQVQSIIKILTALPVAQFAGEYKKTFPFNFSTHGISSTGTVNLTMNFDEKGGGTCHFSATQKISGGYQGVAVSGSGSGSSTSCSGTMKDDGSYTLKGSASGFGTSTVMGYSSSAGSSAAFTITGKVEQGNTKGNMSMGGFSFGF